jgi:hypothetical protein
LRAGLVDSQTESAGFMAACIRVINSRFEPDVEGAPKKVYAFGEDI